MEEEPLIYANEHIRAVRWQRIRTGILIVFALIIFLFAINLMVASLNKLGSGLSETILFATSNPFNGLFIGLLITALLQSSSTTTSLVVAFVASRAISVEAALPIIMGANIGTTITSTIVSLGFISKKKEFRRAVAAGTYHDIFNILTVLVLFPLQFYYGLLGNVSSWLADLVFVPVLNPVRQISTSETWFDPIIAFLDNVIPSGLVLSLLSLLLLFGSILLFRRLVSNLLNVKQPQRLSRFFFRSEWKSFFWGLATTAAIRSSTITTSVVVPVVAKKIVNLKQAAPFILGANVGTTVTAFIVVTLNATTREAIIIASAHLLFNLTGVLLFLIIPGIRKIPFELANRLGTLTLKYRMAGLVYLLSTFFFVPFILIYLNQDTVRNYRLVYQKSGGDHYRINVRMNHRTMQGEWTLFAGKDPVFDEIPTSIQPVSYRNKTLLVGDELFLFNRPGFCWDIEKNSVPSQTCVADILPRYTVEGMTFDSVYVFQQTPKERSDSTSHWYFFSAPFHIILLHEADSGSGRYMVEKLAGFEVK